MTRTMHFDSTTLYVVIAQCTKTGATHFAIAKRNPTIATLFCHCERSEAIFLPKTNRTS
ncbi:MAG: hypothetical protein U0586_10840 [Candidatus Brocadiaceae bacterium]